MSTTREPYAGPLVLVVTRFLLVATAVIALIAGPAYWINGLTQATTPVHVPVQYDGTREGAAPPAYEYTLDAVRLPLPADLAGRDDGTRPSIQLTAGNDELDLAAGEATLPEWMLTRGDRLLSALALGVGALLLWRVIGSVGEGRPFVRGNAARIRGLACAVAVGGLVAPLLPLMASSMVLGRLGVAMPGGPLRPPVIDLDLTPLLLIGVLLALAEAFRRGERLARETDGLV